jgi:hypothetical protein
VTPLPLDETASFSESPSFGPYRVLHQAGSGVLGPVFRAHDPRDERIVAIKALTFEISPGQLDALADALRTLTGAVAHPNLISVLDSGVERRAPYLVMSYESGETLDLAVRRFAPAPLERALSLLAPLGAGLDALWAHRQWGHGALHPRDVFIDHEAATVRLGGWGLARLIESTCGPLPPRRFYAAPERAHAGWGGRADVFSLGVIAHELLTRRRPAGPGEQDGELSPDVPPEQRVRIRRVLARALDPAPDRRFGTARELVEALAHTGGLTVEPAPSGLAAAPSGPLPIQVREHRDDELIGVPSGTAPLDDALHRPVESDGAPARPAFAFEADIQADLPLWRGDAPPVLDVLTSRVDQDDGDLGDVERKTRRRGRWESIATIGILVVGLAAGGGLGYRLARPGGPASGGLPAAVRADAGADRIAVDRIPRAPETTPPVDRPVEAASPLSAAEPTPDRSTSTAEAASYGRLVVRSEPTGAMVRIDGRLQGTTPVVATDLPLGPHTLEVARPGYGPHAQPVTLTARSPVQTLEITLEPGIGTNEPSGLGAIDVDSRPRGARVVINGRFVGHAPLRVPEVRPGSHLVIVEMPGRSGTSRRVQVAAGQIARVRVDIR